MRRISNRPTRAELQYEQTYLRPRRWPPTALGVAQLWDRAKELFSVVLVLIISAADIASRTFLSPKERRDLLARLQPVEKLARLLLVTQAMEYLMGTAAGQRLRATAKREQPPVSCASPQLARRLIPMPGWQTIAAFHPRIDPRVEERRSREKASLDPLDSQHWRCRFHTMRWRMPEREPVAALSPPRRFCIFNLEEDSHFPLMPESPRRLFARDHDTNEVARPHALARRIEALSRILADPAPAIRRLARRLAGLAADDLGSPNIIYDNADGWWHGLPEIFNALDLAREQQLLFAQTDPHPPDPG